ncbi:AAA family ATPase [Pseudomonas alloputida]|uniref:AAA family ATPase n=1 Tax=Pseudomonas alloputida TaxID=1940621 RepID=UPI003B42DD83
MQGKMRPPAAPTARKANGTTRTTDPSAERNSKQAIDFLKRHSEGWAPEWYVQVVAIVPDGPITARTVHPDRIDDLAPFIEQHNGKANLYFAPNPLRRDPGKKASKGDIAALAYYHVDLDPQDGQPLDKERARLRQRIDTFEVQPTTLIDSGNGLGAFWKRQEPIPHDGNTAALEDVNKRLAQALGGDACHNIDRVMRLPGTVNLPTATKLAKERVPAPAQLLEQNECAYSPDAFSFLPAGDGAKATAPKLDFDTSGIDEISLATRFAIHQQHDPDLKLLLEGKTPMWVRDKSGSGSDNAIVIVLRRLKYLPAEALLLLSNYEHGKTSRERDQKYLETTINKHYAPKAKADPGSLPTRHDEYYIASFSERRKNRKPNRWQVKGRFRRGTLNVIFGASGTYKSTTLAGLAVSISCCPYWHDCLIENGGGGVLVIAAEDDEGIVDMIEAACIEYGVNPDDVSVYITHGGYDLSNPEVIQGIKASIAAMPVPLSAIVVDTLNRNCGGLDENSASDMRTFLNMLEELRGDATVYVIHHNGHGDKQRERGSYAIRCNADSSVLCEYVEDTKLFTMTWEKLRSAPTPKPLTLKPKAYVIRQEADSMGELENVTAVCMVMAGEDLRQAREDAFYRKYPELGAGKRRSFLRVLLARIFNKPDEKQTALAAVCEVSQSVISGALVALRNRGLVTEEPLQLTKAGVEALNEITLDMAVSFKADGHDVRLLAREKPVNAQEEARNALL